MTIKLATSNRKQQATKTNEELFSKNAICAFPKRWVSKCQSQVCRVFWKKNSSYTYMKIYTYIYIYAYIFIFMKSAFPKHNLLTWHWDCNLDFWIGVYCFRKKSSSIAYCVCPCARVPVCPCARVPVFPCAHLFAYVRASARDQTGWPNE